MKRAAGDQTAIRIYLYPFGFLSSARSHGVQALSSLLDHNDLLVSSLFELPAHPAPLEDGWYGGPTIPLTSHKGRVHFVSKLLTLPDIFRARKSTVPGPVSSLNVVRGAWKFRTGKNKTEEKKTGSF